MCAPALAGRSSAGTRGPALLGRALEGLACLKAAGITERFTIHGLRRTFNDLSRRAGVDAVVIRSLTGHVTEKMRAHYSTVSLDEKRVAVASVHRLIPVAAALAAPANTVTNPESGYESGYAEPNKKTPGC